MDAHGHAAAKASDGSHERRMACPAEHEPIAIIGIGCRLPGGANDAGSFWRLLRDGRDAITKVPSDRWSIDAFYDPATGVPGKSISCYGGFIHNVGDFDADFFGISPREAARMDPQQRLLLEVAWEAIEDAGQVIDPAIGSDTGVFVGLSNQDYMLIQNAFCEPTDVDAHSNTGVAVSIAANRISYCLNLRGPSMVVDTACSASLVAVHLACRSLRHGECRLALAGGVNLLLKPEGFVGFSKLSMLSPDGKSKVFDARANGMTRSEGAAMIALKPLAAAVAAGDPVYAVILASATNQDGRTTGLTMPNGKAQEALMAEACAKAGIDPARLQYVEAHGTGTTVGDPIEANALGAVLSVGRPAGETCVIGSVKSNLGHLEPASGIAGLLKTTLALKHREIPPNLHFETPNPDIPFEKLKLRVAKRLEPWPAHTGPALAGVNSFGFGGSNAHIVLQEPPAPAAQPMAAGLAAKRPWLLPLSARSQDALEDIARAYHEALSDGGSLADAALRDVCYTSALRRLHHDYRLAVVAEDRRALIAHLGAFLMGERRPTVASNRVTPGKRPKVAFVCSGQGPQWWAMGRELYAAEPVYADIVNRCDAILQRHADWSLRAELLADEADSKMDVTSIAQPAIFAIQVALAALWRSWGVEPDLVIGHSVGEVAAAHIAGALSLEDAVRVILHRGRCMDLASAEGAMLAVGLSPEQARAAIAGHADRVSVAACNSPTACTLSGDREPLEAIRAELDAKDVFCRFLRVNYAFHSAHMEPIQDELIRSLDGITPKPAAIPLVSTVTGDWIDGETLTPAYWWKNVRQSVRFAEGVDKLIERECDTFVELSPHPVLGSAVTECLMQHGAKATVVASLRRKEPEQATMLGSLAALYTVGYPVDWTAMHPDGGACVRLPVYPWQRQRLWHETKGSETFRLAPNQHPLLGRRLNSAHPAWETRVDTRLYPYLRDHCVQGHALLPGTGYFEMALAAAARVLGDGPCAVEEFELPKACFVSDDTLTVLHTVLNPNDNVVQIASETDPAEDTWTVHAQGRVRQLEEGATGERVDLDAIRGRCTTEVGRDECYRKIHEVGLDYGPTFQGIGRLWTGHEEALAQMRAPDELGFATAGYLFHPAVLDACFQVITGAIPAEGSHARHVYLAVHFEQVRVYGRPGTGLWTHARIVEKGNRELVSEVRVCDGDGNVVLEVRGLRAQAVDDAKAAESDQTQDLLYEYQWQLKPIEGRRCVRGAAESLPSPKAMLQQVRPHSTALVEHLGLTEQFGRFEEQIDATSPVYIVTALRALGWDPKPGDRMTTESLADQLGVADRHRRLLHWYLGMLEEEGILRTTATGWEVRKTAEVADLATTWRTLLAENPAFYAELAMLERCGRHLPEMLRGEVDPLQLIFPEGSLAAAEHLYQDAPMLRFANTVAQHVVHEALRHLPRGRTIRVLEIGAGTGGLSTFVLPELPADRTEYVFTDLSKHFFNKAEQKFRDFPFIEYRIFDVEQDPAAQGFEPHTFDLIFASEVLHATQDLRQTLRNVKKLLASDGLLVTLEAVKRSRWIDLVFGLTDGWWRFTDTDLRPSYPLLPLSRWCDVLVEEGFREPCDMSGQDEDRVENAVIVARGPQLTETVAASLAGDESTLDGEWLLFADRGGTARRLADRIEEHGGRCTLVFAGTAPSNNGKALAIEPDRPEAMDTLLLGDGRRYRGIVHLWNLDAPSAAEATTPAIEAALTSGCLSTVYLAQSLSRRDNADLPRLWLVTRGAQSVESQTESVAVVQAPALGIGRVVVNEYPQLRTMQVDLSPTVPDVELDALVAELGADDREDEIALRGEGRYVHRFVACTLDTIGTAAERTAPVPCRLEISKFGVLDQLAFREMTRRAPGADEVEIQVCAAGLNFADVMKGLGLYPGLPDGPVPLGIECSGIITAVGSDVDEFAVGDEVMAIASFSFGTHVTTPAHLVARKPAHIGLEEAATVPVAFLTAYYALEYLGRLRAGERVLIHAATGGVGLAAIQIAQRAGAEIFATAGTPEKRHFLHSLGIDHVYDSRSLAFADEIMRDTGGEGVDIVLNSLAGEAIGKSLGLLRDYGRFLEIGKRDIYANSRIGLRPFRKNVSFFAIDLDRGMRERPDLFASLYREIVQCMCERTLGAIPYRLFGASRVVSAFRHMSQAKHIGKVVIGLQDPNIRAVPARHDRITLRADATYLITGGLGGIGLLVAEWMIERGARHLVLVGRRGIHSPECQEAIDAMRASGAEVVVAQADVARGADVARVIADIARTLPPLRGVVHAAMVLEDCLLFNLDAERMFKVTAPKINGAWNLHTQTLDTPLDFFMLFSSMSSMFGISGQANYGAANAFLDALAHERRSRGLPALTINWGSVGGVGYVARHKEIVERFDRDGVQSLPPDDALNLMERLLEQEAVQVGVMRLDWRNWRGFTQTDAVSPRFLALVRAAATHASASASDEGLSTRKGLLAAPPEQRMERMQEILRTQVARVLGASAEHLDINKPLTELGLDSLMGVELRNWIEGELRLSLPTVELMRGPSVVRLATVLLEQLGGSEAGAAASAASKEAASAVPARPAAIVRLTPGTERPLAFAQQRLWMLEQLMPGATAAMNNCVGVRLTGTLNIDALRRSVHEIVGRHETLRTRFVAVDGRPGQVVVEDVSVDVPLVDLQSFPADEREAELQRLATEFVQRPFELGQVPLLRVGVFRLAGNEHVAVAVAHHIAADGWSLNIFARDFVELYSAFTAGKPSPLAPLPIQYTDYAAWQRATMEGETGKALLAYWKKQLVEPLPVLELPMTKPRPPVESFRGETQSFALDAACSERVKTVAREVGCTPYVVLLAAFKTLLHRYTGQVDILVGAPIANRTRVETEQIIGFLSNTVLLRTDLSGDPTFRELLQRERDVLLGAQEHQELPFELLVAALRPQMDPARSELFQVLFNLYALPLAETDVPGLHIRPMDVDARMAPFDLNVLVQERGRRIEGFFNYKTDRFDAAAISRMISHFRALLDSAVARPDERLSSLSVLTEEEKYRLVAHGTPVADRSAETNVCERIEAQAARIPDQTACVFDEAELTYAELDARANQIAAHVRTLGVRGGAFVGLCLGQSELATVALLGILKAGGACVRLDGDAPDEQLAFVLNDARPAVILTTEEFASRFDGHDAKVVCLDREHARIKRLPRRRIDSDVELIDAALVRYSLDAGGEFFGGVISHRALAGHCSGLADGLGLSETDRVLPLPVSTANAALPVLLAAWGCGATVLFCDEAAWYTPDEWQQRVELDQPTVLSVATDGSANASDGILSTWQTLPDSIRLVVTEGLAQMPASFHARMENGAAFAWVNLQRPSEFILPPAFYRQRAGERMSADDTVSIGLPLGGAAVYVLGLDLQLAPHGVRGELYVGGDAVPRAVREDAAWVAQRLVPDPFGAGGEAKLYRTRRAARYRPDGQIELL